MTRTQAEIDDFEKKWVPEWTCRNNESLHKEKTGSGEVKVEGLECHVCGKAIPEDVMKQKLAAALKSYQDDETQEEEEEQQQDANEDLNKAFYHNLGLNIVKFSDDKIPLDENDKHVSGNVLHEHVPIRTDVAKADNWGVKHSTDPRCGKILFLDWDDTTKDPPEGVKKMMLTYRKKNGGTSYHGIIRVVDANDEWCAEFIKKYHVDGLEIFNARKNLTLFGTYNIKDSKERSKWFWIDDLKANKKLIDVTKKELGKLFSSKKPQNSSVPAGRGMRHQALIGVVFDVISILNTQSKKTGETVTDDAVFARVMATDKIQQMKDYSEDGGKRELLDIIKWCQENYEDFGFEYVKWKYNFAHIVNLPEKEQFNLQVYKDNTWTDNAAYVILEELMELKTDEFKPTSSLALEIAKRLSSDSRTLKVRIDKRYRDWRMRMVIDNNGHFYDLRTGEIGNVDAGQHFFQVCDVRYNLTQHTTSPDLFIEFLKCRFGEQWELVCDHLAGCFLHAKILGGKPKMLFVIGNRDTYKSLIPELFSDLLDTDSVSSVSLKQLGEDVFAPALLGNRLFNYSEEENITPPKDVAQSKNYITKIDGKVRRMHRDGQYYCWRFPRWVICCNKLPNIGENDEDDSVFIRNMYIDTRPVDPSEKEWRKVFVDEGLMTDIMMYLLRRAHTICSNPNVMKTQTIEETRQGYIKHSTGDVKGYIEKFFEKADAHVGVNLTKFKHDFKKNTGNTKTRGRLKKELEELGYDVVKSRCEILDGGLAYHANTDNANTTLDLILGLRQKTAVPEQKKL